MTIKTRIASDTAPQHATQSADRHIREPVAELSDGNHKFDLNKLSWDQSFVQYKVTSQINSTRGVLG
jgi:hypothetical protein